VNTGHKVRTWEILISDWLISSQTSSDAIFFSCLFFSKNLAVHKSELLRTRECPMILFEREKLRSQQPSEAGIEMIEIICSMMSSDIRFGVFLARKFESSIYRSTPGSVSRHLHTFSSLQKNWLGTLSTRFRMEFSMSFSAGISSAVASDAAISSPTDLTKISLRNVRMAPFGTSIIGASFRDLSVFVYPRYAHSCASSSLRVAISPPSVATLSVDSNGPMMDNLRGASYANWS
jgi:hypothetical protein